MNAEPHALPLQPSFQNRYILTRLGSQQIAFPAPWVTEIMVVARSHILALPFYDRALLGLVHHQGHLVPLVRLGTAVSGRSPVLAMGSQETLTAIRCSQSVENLVGVGIVVDRVIGSIGPDQLAESEATDTPIQVFQPDGVAPELWQPR